MEQHTSHDKKVQVFLDEMKDFDPDKYAILEALRAIVFAHDATAGERIMYGGIIFSQENDWGGIFSYKGHISFEFNAGCRMDDPTFLLERTGKHRRHVKLRSLEEVAEKKVDSFVKQALALTEGA